MSLNSPQLPDLTNKGDIAVFGLGYAVGFTLYTVLFGTSGPGPTTSALVFAVACLSVKYGYEARQEEPTTAEPASISEHERYERLRTQLNAFGDMFVSGVSYTEGERRAELGFEEQVVVETRWDPNPAYDPNNAAYTEEKPNVENTVTENLHVRYLALRALWESGVVTDEYTEARLSELTDLLYRKVELYNSFEDEPETAQTQAGEQDTGEAGQATCVDPHLTATQKRSRHVQMD